MSVYFRFNIKSMMSTKIFLLGIQRFINISYIFIVKILNKLLFFNASKFVNSKISIIEGQNIKP
jgi:hypothetical protein